MRTMKKTERRKEKVLSSIIKEDTDKLRRNEQENERG